MALSIEQYAFFKKLTALPYVEAVYILGSRARPDPEERADLDLGILCPQATPDEWKTIGRILAGADILLRVDAVRLDAVTDPRDKKRYLNTRTLLYLREYAAGDVRLHEMADVIAAHSKNLVHSVQQWHDAAQKLDGEKQIFLEFLSLFEAAWVLTRRLLKFHGLRTHSPLSTFREAYMEGWIENRALFETMICDYASAKDNPELTELADIYRRIPQYVDAIAKLNTNIAETIAPYVPHG